MSFLKKLVHRRSHLPATTALVNDRPSSQKSVQDKSGDDKHSVVDSVPRAVDDRNQAPVVAEESASAHSRFSTLPQDILLEILCLDFTPRDLVAISHTCRSLRSYVNLDIVWHSALLHREMNGQIDFPLSRPPTLNLHVSDVGGLPLTNSEGIHATSLPIPSSPVCVQWVEGATIAGDSHRGNGDSLSVSSSYEQFQRMLRTQHALAKCAGPTLEPLVSITPNPNFKSDIQRAHPDLAALPSGGPGMSLSTRGELLALWFSTWEVHVVDLRPHRNQRQYIIKLDGNMSSREDSLASNFWNCTCVEPFRYGEQEGFVLAVEMRRKLNVIFQPLHTSDNGREGVIPPVVVATLKLRLPDCLTLVKISGHWLTFVEVEGGEYGWVYLSVVDLTSGQHWSSEWEPLRGIPLDIEVINNEYVTAAILRTPRHFRLLPNGEMLFLHSENGLLFPPPVLAPQLLAPYSSSGRPFFATWYETNDGVWYAEDELRPPSYSSSTTGLEPDSVGDTNSVPPHPQPPEAPLIIRNTSQVNAPIPPSVFGEPADWDPVARAWYEWGTKRGFRGLLVDMLPQPKRSAAPTKPSAISSLPISPKGYRFTRKPQMLAGCSYPGDARNCLSLVCPFTVVRDGFEEYPLADRANVVLTRVVRSTEKNGEKQLEHQLLMVRQSPKFTDSQGASGELGDDHEVPGSKNEVRPLIVRSEEIVILWSTIAGVLVARERTLNGYQTVVYRFVTDPI